MKRTMYVLLAALLLGAVTALGGAPSPAVEAAETTATRLAVVDFETNTVTVLDASTGEALAGFGMPGPGTVYGSSSGRWFYVIHTSTGRVSVIDSGLSLEDHGDHVDLERRPPFVRGTVITGRRPIDTWVGNGYLTTHNDDDGSLAVFEDKRLEVALDYAEIRGAGTGHNNGLILGDYVLLSLASAGRVTAYRMDGSAVQTFEGCPGTHGWAIAGDVAAAGCADGVMIFTLAGGQLSMSKVNNPAGTPMGTRVGTVRASANSPVMVGNWGSGLAIIRPGAAELQAVPLPTAPRAFSFTPDGARLIVLTNDGNVHALSPSTGQVLGMAAAVEPYTPAAAGQPPVPAPGMVVGSGVAYLTNPTIGQIVEVNTNTMTVSMRMNVGGAPTSIAMVSMTGEVHD
jgi:hypothetical protein